MLRILHTEWSDGWGGQERRVVSEMVGMKARGHYVRLATRPQCRIGLEAQKQGVPVEFLPMRGNADLVSVLRLARLLKREAIQVVNTHSGVDSWIGGLAAKLAATPVLVRTRHLGLPLRRHPLNFVHYMPDRVIACGEAMGRYLVEECGFPKERVVSIPTGIDFDQFQPRKPRAEVRRELGLGDAEFVVLMVGVIRGVKRHEVALQAFQRFSKAHPGAHLLLAGDGPMRREMERLAQSLGIAGRVRFLGHRDDVPDLLAAADALLLTSRMEGVPQAVTQALGLGVPVVATAVGGVPELVEHEQTGLLIPPEDPQAAADALSRIVGDPQWASQLGAAGREHTLARFSLSAMLDRTEALLGTLLAAKTGNP